MMSMDLAATYSYVDKRRDHFTRKLQELLRQPSISTDHESCTKCAKLLSTTMTESGIDSRLMPVRDGPPVVFGQLRSKTSKKTLLCYDHYDVKPVDPVGEWISDPFSAEIRENRIYARGATDNKSGCLAFTFAAEALLRTTGDVPVNLKFVFEGEEELGSTHLEEWALENRDLLKADGLVSLDGGVDENTGKPEIGTYGKGVLYVELRAKGPREDIHSGSEAMVVNPIWRIVWALNSIKGPNDEILVDGWYNDLRTPTEEDIASIKEELATFNSEEMKAKLGTPAFAGNREGLDLLVHRRFRGTAAICGIYGGYTKPGLHTVVPKTAFAKMDFRCPPYLDPEIQFTKLRKHLDTHGFKDIELAKLSTRGNAWITDRRDPVVQAVKRAIEKAFPDAPLSKSGTAEGVFRVKLGIPAAMSSFSNYDNNLHAPNENCDLDHYVRGIKYAGTIMSEYAV
jgi:acetylornithine deacetylase/succinyl-diaminopimelate desuccinylase-like protein